MADKILKKFMGGRMTPQEAHSKFAFPQGAKCMCGARPVMAARTFMPVDELRRRDPYFSVLCELDPNVMLQMIVRMSDGKPYARVSTQYACSQHTKELERAAARHPSWAIVDIDRGPDPTNRVTVGPSL